MFVLVRFFKTYGDSRTMFGYLVPRLVLVHYAGKMVSEAFNRSFPTLATLYMNPL